MKCLNMPRARHWLAGLLLAITGLAAQAQAGDQDEVLETLFLEGMEALGQDRLQSAITAFQSILSQQPRLHRARLELALAYSRALDYAAALRLAREVLDDPRTPPQVRVTVLAFMAQVQADQAAFQVRHRFRPAIGLGLMYDSNVNVGPGSDVIGEIPGATLSAGSLERSDWAGVLTAGLTHQFQPGKTMVVGEHTASFLWQSQVNLYHRAHLDEDDFDLTVLTASSGPAWVVLRRVRLNMALTLDRIWLGRAELARFVSLDPTVTWQFHNSELTWDASLTDRQYDKAVDAGREGSHRSTGVSYGRHFLQRKVAAQLGGRVLEFRAVDDRFGHDGFELSAGLILNAWQGGSLFGRANFRSVEFDGPEPAVNLARDERERRFLLGFQHDFRTGQLEKWRLDGSFQYTENDSNISFFNYDRRQITLNLRRDF